MVRVFDMDEVLEAPELVLQFCLEICLLSDASLVKPLVYSMIQYLLFKRKKTKNVSIQFNSIQFIFRSQMHVQQKYLNL